MKQPTTDRQLEVVGIGLTLLGWGIPFVWKDMPTYISYPMIAVGACMVLWGFLNGILWHTSLGMWLGKKINKTSSSVHSSSIFDNTISIICHRVVMPEIVFEVPHIHTVSLYLANNDGFGRAVGFGTRIGTAGERWDWGGVKYGYKCEVKNYEKSAIYNLQMGFSIEFRPWITISSSAKRQGKVIDNYHHAIAIPVLNADAAETFEFYIINMSRCPLLINR